MGKYSYNYCDSELSTKGLLTIVVLLFLLLLMLCGTAVMVLTPGKVTSSMFSIPLSEDALLLFGSVIFLLVSFYVYYKTFYKVCVDEEEVKVRHIMSLFGYKVHNMKDLDWERREMADGKGGYSNGPVWVFFRDGKEVFRLREDLYESDIFDCFSERKAPKESNKIAWV